MMTLEEAINHAREVAEKNRKCHEENTIILSNRWISSMCCAEEHEQLAEWLEELKKLTEKAKWIPCSERLPEDNTDVSQMYRYEMGLYKRMCGFSDAGRLSDYICTADGQHD